MLRLILVPFALILFVVGLVLAPTPIPIGIPLMSLALFILLATSKTAIRMTRRLRKRHPRLDDAIKRIEDRTAGRIASTLRRTRPRRKELPRGPDRDGKP